MASHKLPGVLWLIAGISSGGIAFFLVDPLDLTIGWVILASLSLPIEQLLSVVWIFGFGVAGAVVVYARRPRTAPA